MRTFLLLANWIWLYKNVFLFFICEKKTINTSDLEVSFCWYIIRDQWGRDVLDERKDRYLTDWTITTGCALNQMGRGVQQGQYYSNRIWLWGQSSYDQTYCALAAPHLWSIAPISISQTIVKWAFSRNVILRVFFGKSLVLYIHTEVKEGHIQTGTPHAHQLLLLHDKSRW